MKPRICEAESLSVKKRWPVFQNLQFDSSPSTQTSKKSLSRRSRIFTVRSVTLSTRRAATGVGAGSGSDSGSSSSNGKSKRSDIVEIDQFFETVADALDFEGTAAVFVGLDNHAVQARIAFSGFKSSGHAGQEPAQRRFHFNADDRIVGSGHADVGQICRAARQDPI